MNKLQKDKMLDLLSEKALGELSQSEAEEMQALIKNFPELASDESFEIAAAAVSLTDLEMSEPLSDNLKAKILADADAYFASKNGKADQTDLQPTFAFEKPKISILNRLGWLVAAVACIALAINLWQTRIAPPVERAKVDPTPTLTPAPSPEQNFIARREALMAMPETVQTVWTDPKNPKEIVGDIVWNNTAQEGFMRFRVMPVNDAAKETYQLWIIDKSQDKPIDGGVFNVTRAGEIIVPIDAKLKVKEPKMFAVTAEKPGGVVVSAQEKVMAVAKIET